MSTDETWELTKKLDLDKLYEVIKRLLLIINRTKFKYVVIIANGLKDN